MAAAKAVSMAAARTMEPIQPPSNVAMTTNAKLASAATRPETVLLAQPVLKISIVRLASDAKPKSAVDLDHCVHPATTQLNADSTKSADSPTPVSVIKADKSAP